MINMQHNVVSILYAVKGMIETYFSRMEESRFDDQEDALRCAQGLLTRIYIQADRAIQVTKRISMTMKTANVEEEPPEHVSVQEIWDDVTDSLKAKYGMNGYDIIHHIPPEFPRIRCRQSDLTEILFCLAENAVQAMLSSQSSEDHTLEGRPASPELQRGEQAGLPAGQAGKLIIRTNLGFRAGEEPIANITISDTGPGIPEDMLTSLFEPFMTTKASEQGNGLGLCLAKNLVRKNGGSIAVSSFKDFGTTFTLTFSVAKSEDHDQSKSFALTR